MKLYEEEHYMKKARERKIDGDKIIIGSIFYIVLYLLFEWNECSWLKLAYEFSLAINASYLVYYMTSVYPVLKKKEMYAPVIIEELEYIIGSIDIVWIDMTRDIEGIYLDGTIADANEEVIDRVYRQFKFSKKVVYDMDKGENLSKGQLIGKYLEIIQKRIESVNNRYAEYISQDCISAFLLIQYLKYDVYSISRLTFGDTASDELFEVIILNLQKAYKEIKLEKDRLQAFITKRSIFY